MEILDNYKEYRKYKPEYNAWANERALTEAKRINYLKKNNITPETNKSDIERAKAALNAVDVMDEYSQSRAEEMEMTIQSASSAVAELGATAGMVLAALSLLSKNIASACDNFFKNKKLSPLLLIPALLYLIPCLASVIFISIFSAKQETKASRLGRAEAMNKKLSSYKQFAILTDEQNKQINEIASKMEISDKEAKKESKATKGIGALNALKILIKGDKESEQKLKELNENSKKDKQNIQNNKPLTPVQIEEAKKDKQLIQNIIEKIDVASQEYAEDVELATGAMGAAALGSGGLLGGLLNFVLKKVNMSPKDVKLISVTAGAVVAIAGAIWATGIQKQASRVARYKVKQDFLSNPEKLLYADDEKVKNESDVIAEKKKKPGFFKFLKQIITENNEYKQYQEENRVQKLKLSKAREQIEYTAEQEKRAKQLQNNIFKMFNKVDEKSQTYSESTEALGEITLSLGSLFSMIPGMILSAKSMDKLVQKQSTKNILALAASYIATLAPVLLINFYTTKEQKSASKVADMLAIKEMDDYRNFADYSDDNSGDKVEISTKNQTTPVSKNAVIEQILNFRANKNNQK